MYTRTGDNMWGRINLRTRIFLLTGALVALTIGGGLYTLWYGFQTNTYFRRAVDQDMAALEAANLFELALVRQKGYLTYFAQDGNPDWLRELDPLRDDVLRWLALARDYASTEEENALLDRITDDYLEYTTSRRKVIELYLHGPRDQAVARHREIRQDFYAILDLAKEYREMHRKGLTEARGHIETRTARLRTLALVAAPVALMISALLVFILLRQVLDPIRRLVMDTAALKDKQPPSRDNDVAALSNDVYSLIEDMGATRNELEMSRGQLAASAKMASVGKLAASVAHSVRNPLTSVKMRLFSLERSQVFTDAQKEDLAVITEEIRHIDNVLRNFLEFSRRPKLEVRKASPSEVVDLALDLIRPRLASGHIALAVDRDDPLPAVPLDAGQLKEALVNLLVNAAEAMGADGSLTITERLDADEDLGRVAVIMIRDNGPGVPRAIAEQVFQPFFSTKSEGTGLGLSIASRIVEEHGGRVTLDSPPDGGACFIIRLPIRED